MSAIGRVEKDAARGTWYFVIDNGINPATGKRRQIFRRGFRTQKLAKGELKRLIGETEDGTYTKPSNQPLRVYLEKWLTTVEASKAKPSTVGMYRHKMTRYVIPRIGAVPLCLVDAATLEALYAELRVSGGRPDAEGNPTPLAESTVAVVHRILRRALRDAVKRNLIRSNPATVVDAPGSTTPREMQVWDAEQLRTFLEHVADDRLPRPLDRGGHDWHATR